MTADVNDKIIHLGLFENKNDAAIWYKAFAELAFGEYARFA